MCGEIIVALEVGLVYGILALGIYLTFRIINFPDLTCDGSFVLGAAVSSMMIKSGCDPYVSLASATIAGGIAGFFTGILNVRLKIEDLLSGIIVAFMLYSVNLKIMGGNPNITFTNELSMFADGGASGKIAAAVFIIVALAAYVLNTDFGLGMRSVGQNKQFAAACGVNVKNTIIIGLVVSNALIGMGGAVFSQYQGLCDISQGAGCLVTGLASVIIGEKIPGLKNVAGKIVACVLGSVIYRIFITLAIHCDIFALKTQDLNFITGIMMIILMATRRKKCCS
jgi:putative ABC transport system permease protein